MVSMNGVKPFEQNVFLMKKKKKKTIRNRTNILLLLFFSPHENCTISFAPVKSMPMGTLVVEIGVFCFFFSGREIMLRRVDIYNDSRISTRSVQSFWSLNRIGRDCRFARLYHTAPFTLNTPNSFVFEISDPRTRFSRVIFALVSSIYRA